MTLQEYLKSRRIWETLIAVGLVAIGFFATTATELIDYARHADGPRPAMAWILESTSHMALLVALPLVLWFDARFPLRTKTLVTSALAHVAFSVVFSALHVTLMYWARKFLFPVILGQEYRWDDVAGEFAYEYLKDFQTYLIIVCLVYLYRFVLLRLQGEAGFLDPPETTGTPATTTDRFLVKKLGKEFLVQTDDIEWIESAGNYVNLHVAGKVYPLRSTMKKTEEKLAERGFIRVHRQAIVNAERLHAFSVTESGDGELHLDTGARVPVSRRYRQVVRSAMGGSEFE
ncbi:MAG: LytTR family DNA-binding domain-containing protein [Pseudomonadota bacterium]